MNPAFIYFREIPLKDNNKFTLDFSDEEFVQKINFNKKTHYYIASLDCYLILKEEIKKDKKKLIEELSEISRKLIEKGAAYHVDIGYLTSQLSNIYDVPNIKNLTLNWVIQPSFFDVNCYQYKYFDTVEKKIKDCKIFSPFTLFKGNGFEFERFVPPKSKDIVSLRLYENNTKIQYIFTHNYQEGWDIVNRIYRDLNFIFVKDLKSVKWYGTSPNLFLEATHYATTRKTKFDIESFYWNFHEIEKKRDGLCSWKFD